MRTLTTSIFAAFIVTGLASAQTLSQTTPAQDSTQAHPNSAVYENYDPLLDLPPLPHNRVTLIGGTVSSLDEVMNKMSVQPFGGRRTMQVAFDTRTRFFQDGHPISYRDIKQGQRIYLDTMLNGTKVFAKSIWIQSAADSGIGRGQIVDFDSRRRILTVRDELSSQSVPMQITASTVIHNGTQPASTADLVPGALVSMQFGPQRELRAITIAARPGTTFVFAGRVTYLDLSRKLIAVDNRSDNVKYDIAIDAIAPNIARQLHEGDQVTVNAVFDGNRYAARQIDLPIASENQR